MIAIRNQFPREQFQTIMFRVWALGELQSQLRDRGFIASSDEETEEEIHQAVYDIAAVMPLNKNGKFNTKVFLSRVSARAKEIEAR